VAPERDNKVFPRTKEHLGSLILSLVFKTCWNLLSTSGLSQICKIRHSLVPRSSEKTFMEFKIIILEEKLSINLVMVMKNFSDVNFSCKFLIHGLRISKQEVPEPWYF
jgi:hypothetical protein